MLQSVGKEPGKQAQDKVFLQINGEPYFYYYGGDKPANEQKFEGGFKDGFRLYDPNTGKVAPYIFLKYKDESFNASLRAGLLQYIKLRKLDLRLETLTPSVTIANFFDHEQIPAQLKQDITSSMLSLVQVNHYFKMLDKNTELLRCVKAIGEELIPHTGGFILPFHGGGSLHRKLFEEKDLLQVERDRNIALGLKKLITIHDMQIIHNDAHLFNMVFDLDGNLHLIDYDDLSKRDDKQEVNHNLPFKNRNAKYDIYTFYKELPSSAKSGKQMHYSAFYAMPYEVCVLTVIDSVFQTQLLKCYKNVEGAISAYNASLNRGLLGSGLFKGEKSNAISILERDFSRFISNALEVLSNKTADKSYLKFGMHELLQGVLLNKGLDPKEKGRLQDIITNPEKHSLRGLQPHEKVFCQLAKIAKAENIAESEQATQPLQDVLSPKSRK